MSEEKKRGRPPAEINLDKLESLAELGCTNREIAAHFGVSERLIEMRRQKEEFRAVVERGVARANISLRRKQLTMALEGDRTMLIWLGKQRLGQQDKIDHSGSIEGGAPTKIHVNFVSRKRPPEEEAA
jgi:hypothetical protein